MRLDGRRQSSNVEDRRGMRGRVGKASLGIGGLIIAGFVTWLLGGNPLDVLRNGGVTVPGGETTRSEEYVPTAAKEEAKTFVSQILAGTEDVWAKVFQDNGLTYVPPKMVIFTDAVQSACGGASAATGPFYCPADRTVYIDLSFFDVMRQKLGADGDFAFAYVVAHEVGHHVQNLLGTLDKAHGMMSRMSQKDANALNVRVELQADYYAGVWAHFDEKMFGSLEPGDLSEGINAAHQIGDDKLQMEAQGYVVPDAFNHGTSAQRMAWLYKGYKDGTLAGGDTFSLPDPDVPKY